MVTEPYPHKLNMSSKNGVLTIGCQVIKFEDNYTALNGFCPCKYCKSKLTLLQLFGEYGQAC